MTQTAEKKRPPRNRGGRSRFKPNWLWLDLCVALIAYGFFSTRMQYPWQLAAPAGLGIGALSYSTHTTLLNLWRLYRPSSVDLPLQEPEEPST